VWKFPWRGWYRRGGDGIICYCVGNSEYLHGISVLAVEMVRIRDEERCIQVFSRKSGACCIYIAVG